MIIKLIVCRLSLGDANPLVLSWAQAYLLVFSVHDAASFETCKFVYQKVMRYRRNVAFPAFFIGVEGERACPSTHSQSCL